MDVGHIKGFGGLGRPGDLPGRVDPSRKHENAEQARQGRGGDSAAISEDVRETLASVEATAERARGSQDERQALVDAARARLANGDLDQPGVHREVARRLLDTGF